MYEWAPCGARESTWAREERESEKSCERQSQGLTSVVVSQF